MGKLYPVAIQSAEQPTEIPWNINMVCAPSYWEKTKGNGVVVAVIDTGLDVNHPEFEGRIISPLNHTKDGPETDVTDKEGHGTHVAGIICGKTVGVAPEARVMPIKVFGEADGFQFQRAFESVWRWNTKYKGKDRIVAVNCSWGGSYDPLVHYWIRRLASSGVAIVCAAGNAGDGRAETYEIWNWPAYLWEVITTAALNQDGAPAGYSSSYDGIDISAPGTSINSAWPGGGYKLLSGTSMATPHVTGAMALISDSAYKREGRLPLDGELDNVLWRHTSPLSDREKELVGRGILNLTWSNSKWPLWRVQLGAYYSRDNADEMLRRAKERGFPVYMTKY